MSRQGTVAILGRPNVGKSSFFNYVTGKRISIVEDVPGVTRDRIYEEVEWSGRHFTLIDTGDALFTVTAVVLTVVTHIEVIICNRKF